MKLKKGDLVKVIAGKDKNKTGKILKSLVKENKVIVEGVNLVTKHRRPRKEGEKGQKVQYPAALAIGKVMLVCPHCGQAVRTGYKISDDQAKRRICKKCQEVI